MPASAIKLPSKYLRLQTADKVMGIGQTSMEQTVLVVAKITCKKPLGLLLPCRVKHN
jgi:hypothetical protein